MMPTVLIAHPDDDARAALSRSLTRWGYHVRFAEGGLQCLRLLNELQPDLLVLDLDLCWGGADGVLALMSESPLLRHIPVALTSPEPRALRRAGSFPPVVCNLVRPYSAQRLLEHLSLHIPTPTEPSAWLTLVSVG